MKNMALYHRGLSSQDSIVAVSGIVVGTSVGAGVLVSALVLSGGVVFVVSPFVLSGGIVPTGSCSRTGGTFPGVAVAIESASL